MSKKQINNRLKNLFANLDRVDGPIAPAPVTSTGWSWECDATGLYTRCSPEVERAMGIKPDSFLGQPVSSYQLEDGSQTIVQNAISKAAFPVDILLKTCSSCGSRQIRMTILDKSGENSHVGFRGYTQILQAAHPSSAQEKPTPKPDFTAPVSTLQVIPGLAIGPTGLEPANQPWTPQAKISLEKQELVYESGSQLEQAVLAVPFSQGKLPGVIELVDQDTSRRWSEDDRLLVIEVMQQLEQAIENARLYNAAQQELTERMRAQQETLRRNRDLAALNQIGQQLNHLASPEEIINLLENAVGQVMDCSNMIIGMVNLHSQQVEYPLFVLDGARQSGSLPPATFQAVINHVIAHRGPIFFPDHVAEGLTNLGIYHGAVPAASVMAIPFQTGARVLGAVLVNSSTQPGVYSITDLELLSTIATQASIALENANLFQQMQQALNTIAVRERYQKNIALAVATLSESGTKALPDVMRQLGEASSAGRVFFAETHPEATEACWQVTQEWWASDGMLADEKPQKISQRSFPTLATGLQERGLIVVTPEMLALPEFNDLHLQGVQTLLAIAISGSAQPPSFIAFADYEQTRTWNTEETDVLQVAASALANTTIREGLYNQLQSTLDETENLYNASRQLSMAGSLQDMIAAITTGLFASSINRAIILLNNTNPAGEVEGLEVAANWYSGWGPQPAEIGQRITLGSGRVLSAISGSSACFLDEIPGDWEQYPDLQAAVAASTSTSMGIIPLVVGRRQLGYLLVLADLKHEFNDQEKRTYPSLAGQLATALENRSLFEQTQSALSETESLYQASAELNTARSYEDIIDVVQKYTELGIQSRNIAIMLFDRVWSGDELPTYAYTIARKSRIADDSFIPRYYLAQLPATAEMLRTNEPILIEDIQEDARVDQDLRRLFLERFKARSTIFIPLVVGGQWIGLINAMYQNVMEFQDVEVRRIMNLAGQAAVAIQNLRSIAEAEERAMEALLLFQTGHSLTQAQNETELYQITLDTTQKGVQVDSAYIYLFGIEEGEIYLEQASAFAKPEAKHFTNNSRHPARIFPFASLLLTGQTVICRSIKTDERLAEEAIDLFKQVEIDSAVMLPLQVRGQNIGTLVAARKESSEFAAGDVTFLRTLETQLSIALDNYRLLKEAQRSAAEARQRSQELALINRVVSTVAASLDLRSGLQTIIDEMVNAFPVTSGSIALLGQDHKSLALVADRFPLGLTAVGTQIPVDGNPSVQMVIQAGKTVVIDDAQNNPLTTSIHDLMKTRRVQTLTMLPLIVNNEVIGIVNLDISESKRSLTTDELRLAETIVFQAATAIQNQRLFDQVQHALAETEMLYQIASAVAEASTSSQLVDLVVNHVMPKNADRTTLILTDLDAENNVTGMTITGCRDTGGVYQTLDMVLPQSALSLVQLITDHPAWLPDVSSSNLDAQLSEIFQQMNMTSASMLPLRTAGRLLGILIISANQPVTFTTQEIRLLQTTSDSIAIALDKQQALAEAKSRAIELQTAAEIARDASSTLAQEMLLQRSVQLMGERFGLYHTAIYLIDEEGSFATIQEAHGQSSAEMKKARFKVAIDNRSSLGYALTTGEPVIINNPQQSKLLSNRRFLPDSQAELAIPLKIGARIIGALDVHASRLNAFSSDEVAVFSTLTDQIAVAIDNARSYELAQKAMAEMREVDRLKSQFLANMSHELRTPLNSIIGFSRVILKGIDGPISEMQEVDLTAIYNSGQHLLALITDILDLSKIEAGKMELQFDNVNLPDLINSVMSTAIGLVKDKPVKLNKVIQPDLPPVWADAMRLRQVLINLMSNAAKFTEEGAITIEAKTQIGPKSRPEVMVAVTDTGPGISTEDQNKLFKAFSQVDDSPTRKTGGTGLGLSISRSFIELHNGRIGLLKSEIGKGSTFFFTLPLPLVEREPDADPGESKPTEPESIIMAVEDDVQVVSLYKRYLNNQGFKVISVTDATQAVSQAIEIKPTAITLDIMMPNMDGWQVLRALKSNPLTRDIPVIVCSILEEEQKGFNLGAADYLVKPILQDELIKALDRLNPGGTIKHILVVDDDESDQRFLKKILQDGGHYQISEALSGEQAWEMMEQNIPGLVILDLFMPGMDGFTLLGQMQDSPRLKDVPVLVISGAELTTEQHQALSEYGHQALVKGSMSEQQLLEIIQTRLSHLRGMQTRANK